MTLRRAHAAYAAGALALLVLAVGCGTPTSIRQPTPPARPAVATSQSSPATSSATPAERPPAPLTRKAFEIATSSADEGSGDSAAAGEAVATTRHRALAAIDGGFVDQDGPVWLFAFSGRFHSNGPRPPGASAPTGRHLYLLMDIKAGRMTDFVLANASADLSVLGASVPVAAP